MTFYYYLGVFMSFYPVIITVLFKKFFIIGTLLFYKKYKENMAGGDNILQRKNIKSSLLIS